MGRKYIFDEPKPIARRELGQPRSLAITERGLQRAEKFGHFSGRMPIAGAKRDSDPGLEQRLGLIDVIKADQQLSPLKITGHVIGMIVEQLSKVLLRDFVQSIRGTAHRQTVSQKRIVWFGGEKLFELFAS